MHTKLEALSMFTKIDLSELKPVRKYPFAEMQPGDAWPIPPHMSVSDVRNAAGQHSRNHGVRLSVRDVRGRKHVIRIE